MTRFSQYLAEQAPELKAKFLRRRRTLSSSAAKGHANEEAVADFIRENVPNWFVATKSQIIDAYDRISDELDVCCCNHEQPFRNESGALLIADGIDFVIQVKAILTDSEMDRALANCRSVKPVVKTFSVGDVVSRTVGVRQEDFARVPFLVFAFESTLAAASIHARLSRKSADVPLGEQPDAVFVLEPGITLLNCRDGVPGGWSSNGRTVTGWLGMDTGESTLVELIRFLNSSVPRIKYQGQRPAISPYLPTPEYPTIGKLSAKPEPN